MTCRFLAENGNSDYGVDNADLGEYEEEDEEEEEDDEECEEEEEEEIEEEGFDEDGEPITITTTIKKKKKTKRVSFVYGNYNCGNSKNTSVSVYLH